MTEAPPPLLMVFARYPRPGEAKTRLIPALGAEGSCELYRRLAVGAVREARRAASARGLALELRASGADPAAFRDWLGPDLVVRPQGGGDLGERLVGAFREAFTRGPRPAVVMGTDCPGLDAARLAEAFAALETHPLVVGPAVDGGYYLLGLRRFETALFDEIPWGTGEVLELTLARARARGLSPRLLPVLADVDRPDDLPVWEEAERRTACRPTVSVVVPALDEEASVAAALASALGEPGVEAVVVDGGSRDRTRRLAETYGARVIEAPRGRARQLNAGAAAARGETLVFLHADGRLPPGYASAAAEALARPGVAGGAFALRLEPRTGGLKVVEWGANLRSRRLGLPYGDQALFVRAEVFRRVGGFPEVPVLEDVEFVRRLHRAGRVVTLPRPVTASARRWLRSGLWTTTGLHALALGALFAGVSARRIEGVLRALGYFRA